MIMQALLSIMAHGSFEGKDAHDPAVRRFKAPDGSKAIRGYSAVRPAVYLTAPIQRLNEGGVDPV